MTASAKGTVEEPGSRVAQKSGLNGSILDQGWGIFFSKLDWKTLRLGGHVHKVPPQNTSRTCPICGSVSKDNRKTQALFKIFFSKLDWKTLRLGGHVHKVPPQNTSRTCPICGSVSKDNRKTQALFKCVSCGHQGNALRLGGHVHKVPPQNTSRTCPICGSVSKDNRKTQALFKCVSCGHQGNADVIAAINIKERGRSSLACGESEKNAWAQVNSGRPKKQMPNQQQESTEVISSASY